MKKHLNTFRNVAASAVTLIAIHGSALADTAGTGGIDQGTANLTALKIAFFGFLGVAALLYMIYHALAAFAEKKTWQDFFMSIGHVVMAGGCVALGTWAWAWYANS